MFGTVGKCSKMFKTKNNYLNNDFCNLIFSYSRLLNIEKNS